MHKQGKLNTPNPLFVETAVTSNKIINRPIRRGSCECQLTTHMKITQIFVKWMVL
jgi:hypothetical protein